MSIFDFTHLRTSRDPESGELSMFQVLRPASCNSVPKPTPRSQLVLAIGDCLAAPFWPEGTGMSRGILSVAHAGFALNAYWSAANTAGREAAVKQGNKWANIGAQAMASDCSKSNCSPQKWKEYIEYGYAGNEPPTRFD